MHARAGPIKKEADLDFVASCVVLWDSLRVGEGRTFGMQVTTRQMNQTCQGIAHHDRIPTLSL